MCIRDRSFSQWLPFGKKWSASKNSKHFHFYSFSDSSYLKGVANRCALTIWVECTSTGASICNTLYADQSDVSQQQGGSDVRRSLGWCSHHVKRPPCWLRRHEGSHVHGRLQFPTSIASCGTRRWCIMQCENSTSLEHTESLSFAQSYRLWHDLWD